MYGGSKQEWLYCMIHTGDGGYLLGGESYSSDIPGTTHYGNSDFLLIKIDGKGNIQWIRMYDGSDSESIYDIKKQKTIRGRNRLYDPGFSPG